MTESSPEPKTFLQLITGIPFIGEYLATLVGLGPPAVVSGLLFGFSEETPGTMLLFAVLSVPWLLLLQRKGRLVIVLPLIPIPLLYLTPIWFVIGIAKFF